MWATGEPRRRPDAGSTLIEAMVVLAILVGVSLLVFPNYQRGLSRAAFDQAATGLRADLRMLRAQALRGGAPVRFAVDPSGQGYGWTPGPRRALLGDLRITAERAPVEEPSG